MPKQSELQDLALEWIERLPSGRIFSNDQLYGYLSREYPDLVKARGDADSEPRFRNDARWAIQKAKQAGIVVDTERGWHKKV